MHTYHELTSRILVVVHSNAHKLARHLVPVVHAQQPRSRCWHFRRSQRRVDGSQWWRDACVVVLSTADCTSMQYSRKWTCLVWMLPFLAALPCTSQRRPNNTHANEDVGWLCTAKGGPCHYKQTLREPTNRMQDWRLWAGQPDDTPQHQRVSLTVSAFEQHRRC